MSVLLKKEKIFDLRYAKIAKKIKARPFDLTDGLDFIKNQSFAFLAGFFALFGFFTVVHILQGLVGRFHEP